MALIFVLLECQIQCRSCSKPTISNPIKYMVDDIANYLNAPLSSNAFKWNNVSTLKLNLRDLGRCVGVDVAACAKTTLSAYAENNNDLGGDNSCFFILPTCEVKYATPLVSKPKG